MVVWGMSDIIVIGPRGIPDVEGGAEKHAEMTFPQFAQHGYSVTLLGVRKFIKNKEYKGVRLRGIYTVRFAQTEKLIYHFLCFCYAAWTRPKLVHLQGLNSAIFLVLYKLAGLKVVVRYGSADHEYAKWGLLGRLGFRLCERQIRYADHVIAVSRKYATMLKERYGLRHITVVPNGIDSASVSEEARAFWSGLNLGDAPYVLAVGRLTVDKDYETLVRAVEDMTDPPVGLVVAGGADESGYADHLFAMGNDRIRFLGRIDRRLLSALYSNCAVYVNCSHHEGLSNAILEAISYERPVIASDIPANREMPLNGGSYFPVADADALRSKINLALRDPEAFIVDKAKFVDWSEVFRQTENVYRSVIPSFASGNSVRPSIRRSKDSI